MDEKQRGAVLADLAIRFVSAPMNESDEALIECERLLLNAASESRDPREREMLILLARFAGEGAG